MIYDFKSDQIGLLCENSLFCSQEDVINTQCGYDVRAKTVSLYFVCCMMLCALSMSFLLAHLAVRSPHQEDVVEPSFCSSLLTGDCHIPWEYVQ